MRKIFTIFLSLISFYSFSQTVLLQEGFETGNIPTNWINIDNDSDNELWEIHPANWTEPHSGEFSIASYSWFNGNILTPDNWLITPAIQIYENTELEFWVSPISPTYVQEHYQIRVSESGTLIANFEDVLIDETFPETFENWEIRTVDLSAYAGQQIYIAFVHQSTDVYALKIDDIIVSTTSTVEISENSITNFEIFPNPVKDNFQSNKNIDYIEIFNLNGQIVKIFQNQVEYNISELKQGVYFVKIYSENLIISSKIVKL